MDDDDVNFLRRSAADKYREERGLLTSKWMIEFRESFGMSQRAFAKYLIVGEASIKRWETYYIQDASQDDHIRLKCDQHHAELNLMNIIWNTQVPDIYTGWRRFSFELFKNAALVFINKNNSSEGLNKLMFYADFLHYKRHGKCITGIRYKPIRSGPFADRCDVILRILEKQDVIQASPANNYQTSSVSNFKIFDDYEKETILRVCELIDGNNTLGILSQKEKGYMDTDDLSYISYEHAAHLLIS